MRYALLSPNRRSQYTAALATLLARDGHSIEAIIVKRLVNVQRLRLEWRAGAGKLAVKIARRFLHLPSPAQRAHAHESLHTFCQLGGVPSDLREVCRNTGARLVFCDDFNAPLALQALADACADMLFFTGGGILRAPLLQRAGIGIVNCHIGPLPRFRGTDVVEWPLLVGESPSITCHFMDAGLDTGPIILQRAVGILPGDTIETLRTRIEPMMLEAMLDVARMHRRGVLEARAQKLEEGRQYYTMHPRLLAIVRSRLQESAGKARQDAHCRALPIEEVTTCLASAGPSR